MYNFAQNFATFDSKIIWLTFDPILYYIVCHIGIHSSLLWGKYNLLADAERYHFILILRHDIFCLPQQCFSTILKNSSYKGRILPVGKKIKRGNSNSLYKRENACADFFYIQSTRLPMPLIMWNKVISTCTASDKLQTLEKTRSRRENMVVEILILLDFLYSKKKTLLEVSVFIPCKCLPGKNIHNIS